jgi:hypothetical protein
MKKNDQVLNKDTGIKLKLGVVVNACNSSYSGGRDRIIVQRQPRQMLARPHLNKQASMVCTTVISAIREAERGRLWLVASQVKSRRSYQK